MEKRTLDNWDPMKEDFNDTIYDPQYADNDLGSSGTQLDHCRLYIRNLPPALNSDGLRAIFSKFGTLTEAHVPSDITKRYGLVSFETPGEARLAMMKLNKSEPLKLIISFAHKRKANNTYKDAKRNVDFGGTSNYSRVDPRERCYIQDDTSSTPSQSFKKNLNSMLESDQEMDCSIFEEEINSDPSFSLEMEMIKLKQLKLQEEQLVVEQRLLLMKQGNRASQNINRRFLSDGRIVVRNFKERNPDLSFDMVQDKSMEVVSAPPPLKQLACELCGEHARAVCSRCSLAGYCSRACQARDWKERHRDMCQLRLNQDVEAVSLVSQAAPLRRPRTPRTAGEDEFIPEPKVTNKPDGYRDGPRQNGYDRRASKVNDCNENFNIDNKSSDRFNTNNGKSGNKIYRNNENSFNRNNENNYNKNSENNFNKNNEYNFNRNNENNINRNSENNYNSDNEKANDNYKRNDNYRHNDNKFNRNTDLTANNIKKGNEGTKNNYNKFNGNNNRFGNKYNDNYRQNNRSKPDAKNGDFDNRSNRSFNNKNEVDANEDWGTPKVANENNIIPPTTKTIVSVKQASTEPKSVTAEPNIKNLPAKTPEKPLNLGTVQDCTPKRRTMVPEKCVVECLSVGDIAVLVVETTTAQCRTSQPGFVCLCLAPNYSDQYQSLCEDYIAQCENEGAIISPSTLAPGDAFSYMDPEDKQWYRARLLNPTSAALLDANRVVNLTQDDKCKRLAEEYAAIPEFSCVLDSAVVKVEDNLRCTVIEKLGKELKVMLRNAESNEDVGEGKLSRWMPRVDHAKNASPVSVPRADIICESVVFIVEAKGGRVFVRDARADATRRYDAILQDVVLAADDAQQLDLPPRVSQMVIAKFTDGMYYRAMCLKTNVSKNKYLLEYIDFGNRDISPLENMKRCPEELDLSHRPSMISEVSLLTDGMTLEQPALEYLEQLKDKEEPLSLTLPTGQLSAPSGSYVLLKVIKSNENVNQKVTEMSTPEWKKIEKEGGDIIADTTRMMFADLEFLEQPQDGCEVDILDYSALQKGMLAGHQSGLPYAHAVINDLSEKMEEYYKSPVAKDFYLPKESELCIAPCPPYPQVFRAVFLQLVDGAGGKTARVHYVDYGNTEEVPVETLRRAPVDFVRGWPALASVFELRGFPEELTETMLLNACTFMQIGDDGGKGKLKVERFHKKSPGVYEIDAPKLLQAMGC